MRKSKPAPAPKPTPVVNPPVATPPAPLPTLAIDETTYTERPKKSVVGRQINPKLTEIVRSDLAARGVDPAKIGPRHLKFQIGLVLNDWHQTEDKGQNQSKSGRIELVQDTIGGVSAEAYCMSTMQSLVALVEVIGGYISNLPASEGCSSVFRQCKEKGVKILPPNSDEIQPTDIALWELIPGKSKNGHTGMVKEVRPKKKFGTIEGNTTLKTGKQGIGECDRDRENYSGKRLSGFIREDYFKV